VRITWEGPQPGFSQHFIATGRIPIAASFSADHHRRMKGPMTAGRPVKVGLVVSDVERSIGFFESAFGFRWLPEIWSFQIGEYPKDDFFLISLNDLQLGEERPVGAGHFGFTVEDVEAVHRRALDAGAGEWYRPQDNTGAPRSSGVLDPDGNRIELFQA
jgi:catechol 2,3-dioxygenase-like lactoylglutathione lyase family enzyme